MLRKAIATLSPDEKPIVHSDRGCHYRWPEWIKIMDDAGLTRSMSRKGCSPDNSACEGFFGHLKTEMFYGYNWVSIPDDSEPSFRKHRFFRNYPFPLLLIYLNLASSNRLPQRPYMVIIPGLFEPPVRTLRFFRKYPFSAFKHCHAYSIIIVVFLQEIIR